MALFKVKPWYADRRRTLNRVSSSISNSIPLYQSARFIASVSTENYAVFGGGMGSARYNSALITAYNKLLTRQKLNNLGSGLASAAAATTPNYIIFGGGQFDNYSTIRSSAFICYDNSLTKIDTGISLQVGVIDLGAASAGEYAVFAGGTTDASSTYSAYVNAVSNSLTRIICTPLDTGRSALYGTSINNYAVFTGGQPQSSVYAFSRSLEVYDSSLTRQSNILPTTYDHRDGAASTINDRMLIAGTDEDWNVPVECYDKFLTKLNNLDSLIAPTGGLASAANKEYAVFGGGTNMSTRANTDNAIAYDKYLTRSIPDPLYTQVSDLAAASINNYIIFGGGRISGYTNVITIYQVS